MRDIYDASFLAFILNSGITPYYLIVSKIMLNIIKCYNHYTYMIVCASHYSLFILIDMLEFTIN